MNDLGHFGRPGGNEERIARCAPAHMPIASALLHGERGAKIISGPGGARKSLKRLNSDKEIQGKPRYYGADATSAKHKSVMRKT
jgi:hypothetical protein